MPESVQSWRDSLAAAIPRLLITGGSGFIGTNAVEFAFQAGIEILSIDIREPKCAVHAKLWEHCDLLNAEKLYRVIDSFRPTHILHLAARTDLSEARDLAGYDANIQGVSNLLDAVESSPCRRALFTSSMLVCRNGYRPQTDDDYCPDTLYGESKRRGEVLVRNRNLSCIWSIVRPTSIWGPWFQEPYRQFFETVARGLYRHPGSASIEKALGFVGNTVWQLYRVLTASPPSVTHKTFYLADYEHMTTRRWAGLIAREFHATPVKSLPLSVMRGAALLGDLARELGVKNPPLTSFRLRNMLTTSGFDLRAIESVSGALPFGAEEGVRQTVAWMSETRESNDIHAGAGLTRNRCASSS